MRNLMTTLGGILICFSLAGPAFGATDRDPLPGAIVPGSSVGYLPASWDVTPHGELMYSIPMEVPPGRAGMQPDIVLAYSSNAPNGIAGVGVSVSGLSSIQRCPRTIAIDGKSDGPNFDETDALCLDGARMIEINTAGWVSEYRTEEDQIARIYGYRVGGEQTSFHVWRKDGRIQHYTERVVQWRVVGGPLGVFPIAQVTTVWLLSSEDDRAGNTMTFEYDQEIDQIAPYGAEYRLRSIRYTGRTDNSETPQREVRFVYEERPDPIFLYRWGTRTEMTKRLTAVEMYAPKPYVTQLVWQYDLSYGQSTSTDRSVLAGVRRCGVFGTCTWSRTFAWDHIVPTYTATTFSVGFPPRSINVFDANGDGLDDLLVDATGPTDDDDPVYDMRLGQRYAGSVSPLSRLVSLYGNPDDDLTKNALSLGGLRPVDPDGDGKVGLYLGFYSCGKLYHWQDDDEHFKRGYLGSYEQCYSADADFVDLDGDGLLDLFRWPASYAGVATANATYDIRRNLGDAFGMAEPTGIPYDRYARGVDLNGDGRGELFAGGNLIGLDADGNLDVRYGLDEEPSVFIDLNGDGLADALYVGAGSARLRWNTGNGFDAEVVLTDPQIDNLGSSGLKKGELMAADIDGDGREDLIVAHEIFNKIPALLSLGDGTFRRIDIFSGAKPQLVQLGDFNGDGQTDVIATTDNTIRALIHDAGENDAVRSVNDISNAGTPRLAVQYTRDIGFAKATTCKYPQRCLTRGMRLVGSLSGSEAESAPEYNYSDPRSDALGRGFLGFGLVREWVASRPVETTTLYDLQTRVGTAYPFAGVAKNVTRVVPIVTHGPNGHDSPASATARFTQTSSVPVVRALNGGKTWFVHPIGSTIQEWDAPVTIDYQPGNRRHITSVNKNYSVLRTRQSAFSYDDYANPLTHNVSTLNGDKLTQTMTYENRVADWLIGLTSTSAISLQGRAQPLPAPRRLAFTYDARGFPETVQVEPNNPDASLRLVTTYVFDADGNLRQETREAPGEPPRDTYYKYQDATGERVFPSEVDNALGHIETLIVHPAYGTVVWATDANGRWTLVTYDDLGRPVFAQREADAARFVTREAIFDLVTSDLLGMRVRQTSQTGAERYSESDAIDRPVLIARRGFSGSFALSSRDYDALGRLVSQSLPGFGAPGALNRVSYDSLDRPLQVTAPDNTVLEHSYPSFFQTVTRDAAGHRRVVLRDRDGRIIRSVSYDNNSSITTRYTFGNYGLLTHVRDNQHHTTKLTYDLLGRRLSLDDPDMGLTTSAYNGFGEEISRTDALGQETTQTYDKLGRVATVDNADGHTELSWDTSSNGLGRIGMTSSPDGSHTVHAYDTLGRPIGIRHVVRGERFDIEMTYDNLGRPDTLVYPEVPGRSRFQVQAAYNATGALGHLDELVDNGGVLVPELLWQVNQRDARGALLQGVYGSGTIESRGYDLAGRVELILAENASPIYSHSLGYEPDGNVQWRRDNLRGRAEFFSYDGHERLRSWTLGSRVTEYRYDKIGNLTDVHVGGVLTEHNVYGLGGRPHLLKSNAAGSYKYDARGRLIVDNAYNETKYTAFDLPRSIDTGDGKTSFFYSALGRRAAKSGPFEDTVYVDNLYERRANGAGIQHIFHVRAPDGHVADTIYDETKNAEERLYLVRDHLGSTAVVLDEQGQVRKRNDYEPFGGRVDLLGLPDSAAPETPYGFTGHEHDDDLGLINMRGRIYAPALRRFLTPDPLVAMPLAGQNLNRYSYVMNNPLRFVDPSGFLQESAGGGCQSGMSTSGDGTCAGTDQNQGGDDLGTGSFVTGVETTVSEDGSMTTTVSGLDITEIGSGESSSSTASAPPSAGQPGATGAPASTGSAGGGSGGSGSEGSKFNTDMYDFMQRSQSGVGVSDGGGLRQTGPERDLSKKPVDRAENRRKAAAVLSHLQHRGQALIADHNEGERPLTLDDLETPLGGPGAVQVWQVILEQDEALQALMSGVLGVPTLHLIISNGTVNGYVTGEMENKFVFTDPGTPAGSMGMGNLW